MSRFWLVRHGPTHARGMVGWTDLPADLSDHGAVARLSAALPADAVLVSSDLSRATATADALQPGRTRLPHSAALREMHFGAWEMRSHAEVAAEDPDAIRAFWESDGSICAPAGESWNDLAARVLPALHGLAAAHPSRDIIVVAHFGVILAAVQHACRMTTQQAFAQKIDTLSVTCLTLREGGWQAGRINHTP